MFIAAVLITNLILAMYRECILVKYLAVCDPLSVICRWSILSAKTTMSRFQESHLCSVKYSNDLMTRRPLNIVLCVRALFVVYDPSVCMQWCLTWHWIMQTVHTGKLIQFKLRRHMIHHLLIRRSGDRNTDPTWFWCLIVEHGDGDGAWHIYLSQCHKCHTQKLRKVSAIKQTACNTPS